MWNSAKKRALPVLSACFWACAACAGSSAQTRVVSEVQHGAYGPALQVYREQGRDRALLRAIAQAILLNDAEQADAARQHAAFNEFMLLGSRARPQLESLAESERSDAIRARALAQLWALGDDSARARLRPLVNDADAEVADLAYPALDPRADAALLQAALDAPRSARRLAALRVLSQSEDGAPIGLMQLAELARVDPQPSVRSAALQALSRYGAEALPAFERALREESDPSVRVVAIEAFARALPERATPQLDQQLGAATTEESLAAAVALLRMRPPREPARARDALSRGLSCVDSALRARAALLERNLPESERDRESLRAQLQLEKNEEVKLALALALGAGDPAARAALQTLAQASTLPAAQAAFELAQLGDAAGTARLLALRGSPSSLTRVTVARLLGRGLRDPEAIAGMLADAEPAVRTAAAGAVLAL
jgi:hypothetical protein